jgi:hypothetical protein
MALVDRDAKVDKEVSEMDVDEKVQEALRAHYETVRGHLDSEANSSYMAELAGASQDDIEAVRQQAYDDDAAEFEGEPDGEPEIRDGDSGD